MKPLYDIISLESVDSTNSYVKNHPELWGRQFCAIVTREQTGGRGRHGRTWHSAPGLDLTFSLVYIPEAPPADISCVTLVAGLAVYRTLKSRLGAGLSIKWPNDICYDDSKIGGILCETVFSGAKPVVIIGIGININGTSFPGDIRQTASSLKKITGMDHDADLIFKEIVCSLTGILDRFSPPLGADMIQEWTAASKSIGKPVHFTLNGRKIQGVIEGILPDGSLHIKADTGEKINGFRSEILFDDDI